jgi:hypothetical protein
MAVFWTWELQASAAGCDESGVSLYSIAEASDGSNIKRRHLERLCSSPAILSPSQGTSPARVLARISDVDGLTSPRSGEKWAREVDQGLWRASEVEYSRRAGRMMI